MSPLNEIINITIENNNYYRYFGECFSVAHLLCKSPNVPPGSAYLPLVYFSGCWSRSRSIFYFINLHLLAAIGRPKEARQVFFAKTARARLQAVVDSRQNRTYGSWPAPPHYLPALPA